MGANSVMANSPWGETGIIMTILLSRSFYFAQFLVNYQFSHYCKVYHDIAPRVKLYKLTLYLTFRNRIRGGLGNPSDLQ